MFRGVEAGSKSEPESRGQTTLDFAIGISIFLAVVMFVFLFVPGIVAPFTTGAQDETVTVNRVADGLTQGQLGSAKRPGVLQTPCTVDFFQHADDATDITQCGEDQEDLSAFVGIKDRQNANVSVYGNTSSGDTNTEMVCWDANDQALVERDGDGASDGDCDSSGSDTLLTAGDTPPTNNADSVTATRVAYLAGEDVTVIVEMW